MSDEIIRDYAQTNMLGNNTPDTNLLENIMNNDGVAIDESQMTESINELMLEEFKKHVQNWMTFDNQIKRLSAASKQLNIKKKELNEKILDFMSKYNIEDLNTKEGVIRYKKSYVKVPLTQKVIREKLNDIFKDNNANLELVNEIFNNGAKKEKMSLTRLKL